MAGSLREIIADNIKSLMNRQELTVTSLAKQAGISRGQINNILTQATDTRMDTLESIARALGTHPVHLLKSSRFAGDLNASTKAALSEIDWEKWRRDLESLYKAAIDRGESDPVMIAYVLGRQEGVALRLLRRAFRRSDDLGKYAILRLALLEAGMLPTQDSLAPLKDDFPGFAKVPRAWRPLVDLTWVLENRANSKGSDDD